MNTVFLEIGGNQGNRMQLITDVKKQIIRQMGELLVASSIYETPPWGFSASQNFYNQILKLHTKLNALEVLLASQKIELQFGRVRTKEQYASRTMDIDIIFFNNERIQNNDLIVPHPRMHERNFVLMPMVEIAADFVHPKFNKSMRKLLQECSDKSFCKKLE